MDDNELFLAEFVDWLCDQVAGLTDTSSIISPVEWAENNRYLPPSLTPLPGPMRYSVAPYLIEIVECLDIRSPIREISVMKGAQIMFTVGVIETLIGYAMAVVKSAPCMMVTADAELAKLRMETAIIPMIQQSGLAELIRSLDIGNTRKTGKTDDKIEWIGGGFLIPFGAKNANKLRSMSIRILAKDEIAGWPEKVGGDGSPSELVDTRTNAYEQSRKIINGSTPKLKGGIIDQKFKEGDGRYYNVICQACNFPQVLRFAGVRQTGEQFGLLWDTQDGILVPDSVRYRCANCDAEYRNEHKTILLARENGAHWVPTQKPVSPFFRSYHISALYSPAEMFSWEACVRKYLAAYDTEAGRAKDLGLYQVFYNNILGESFEVRGNALRFSIVSGLRRGEYRYGEVPNQFAMTVTNSPVLVVTCAVDVHAHNLAVGVFGWTRGGRAFLLDYWRLKGDTEQLDDPGTWGELSKIIESKEYISDDGKIYRIALTFVDSGYRPDQVYQFCSQYVTGVYPIRGVEAPPKSAKIMEFSEFTSKLGTRAFNITVDIYKDRWSAAMRRMWESPSVQPFGHFNAPTDITDKQLKELTVEHRSEKTDKETGKSLGFEWVRPGNAANELWDLLMYNTAAYEMVAYEIAMVERKQDAVNWPEVWDILEREQRFFTLKNSA